MSNIPKDKSFDSSLALLQEGFPFLLNRSLKYGSDIFETRLMLQPVTCLHGEEAAALFYNPELFKRKGAVPRRVKKTLLGKKGVQSLDDGQHRHRKEMFMSLMTRENIQALMEQLAVQWKIYCAKWERVESLVLFEEVQQLICRAACNWAGVPLQEAEVKNRAYDFIAMIDAFGAVGPRHWRGRLARQRGNNWVEGIIEQVRQGKLFPAEGTAAYVIAWHHNPQGQLLDKKVAAVELINIIRPIVAITYYITFAAHALHKNPECLQKLRNGDSAYIDWFVQETRRYYPFAPFLGARARKDLEWRGFHIPKGRLVLLDVYGTNNDPRSWEHPNRFIPERFKHWNGSPFNFIPQGGGDFLGGHRCAGEWITIEATKLAVDFLANHIVYKVPEQDLSFSLARIPTYPKSGFMISYVKRTKAPVPI